ncbi:aspartyl-tRNA(Asn)/glutamyl-tRNA(Gln) amidotransferase subunit A [Humitalea rosea]|uniref:Aspartyl-tRNA(Asn)/glutamyl-tRNA(Gln) amidotransferase subunit A n=1 Tax=Humitalea rosea TaxID=990373 RepID=A0A2W7HVI7_9PROT|nr:amidase family protein [Humitalea rosea]PZW38514.1 aspartyl-tRNA(Asn)/glutamyl-tRNA(Gln) amidotransferase subunit A [Humitalea rosea]
MPNPTDLADLSAHDLAARIRERKASPVEALDAVLTRIAAWEPRLNAFVAPDFDRARAAAKTAEAMVARGEALGPLHGVPVTIKDVQHVAGLPTRWGSVLTDPTPVATDSPVVARLKAAGAIVLGKTTMPERGWVALSDGPLTGTTHNPWKHAHTAGGSSSGAAALAAIGGGPLHLGSDGAGSVRLPAHFCGVVGLKPTFGRVPYPPSAGSGLSHLGPLTRDVRDAALMLSVMAGPDPSDATTLPGGFDAEIGAPDLRGVRIAYSATLGHARVDPEIAAMVAAAVAVLAGLGATVEAVDPPWGPTGPEVIRRLWSAMLLPTLARDEANLARMDPGLVACLRAAGGMTPAEIIPTVTARLAYAATVNSWFEDAGYDLLVTPSASVAAFPTGQLMPDHWPQHPWDWLSWAEFSYPFNLSHGPALSMPCGLTAAGLPVGMQIAGPRFCDAAVLRAAAAFEAARPIPRIQTT